MQLSRLDHLSLIRSVASAQRRCSEDLALAIAQGDNTSSSLIAQELFTHARAACALSSDMWPFEDEETDLLLADLDETITEVAHR